MKLKYRLTLALKYPVIILSIVVCILFLIECQQDIARQQGAITGIDDIGRVVTLSKPAQRIVLMTGSPTDALYALGAGERIVAITDGYGDSYPATVKKFPELLKLPGIGTRSTPNVEAILALKPDLILVSGSGENPEKNAVALKKAGLPYAIMKSFITIEDACGQIERLAVFCGKKQQGKHIADNIRRRIEATAMLATTASANRPRVFFWWGTGNGTYGDSSAVSELINRAGGTNIAAHNGKGFFDCSLEYIVNSDPEVIVYSYWREQDREVRMQQLKTNPGFNKTSAVRNERIYAIDGHLLHGSLLLPQAQDSLIRWIHPELFTSGKQQDSTGKRTIIDDCGRMVIIPADPRRIISLATSDVEILFAIGASDRLCGIPDGVKFPPAALSIERIGGMYGRFSPEKIVGRSPDLVLMTISGWKQYRKHLNILESHGVTAIGLQYPRNFDELITQIYRIRFLTGKFTASALLVDSLVHRRDLVIEKTVPLDSLSRPRVYIEWVSREGGRGSTCGINERNHEIVTMAGGRNIFDDRREASFTASDEEVINRNPQVIIITADTTITSSEKLRKMVAERGGWNQTDAIKNNRIYCIDAQLTWANPRMIEGIEQCARIIHSELFN